jgi:rubrerythrin
MTGRGKPDRAAITDLAELLAHALAIEHDAQARYEMLADQMEQHNNSELCGIFLKLASHEKLHAQEISDKADEAGLELPHIELGAWQWPGGDSPEAVDVGDAHYLMTAWHALRMALAAEQRAFAFFDRIARFTEHADLRKWAEEFRTEEAEHVRLVEDLLTKYPKPASSWDDDPDPPVLQG